VGGGIGEPRDWFFRDYLEAAERPLPFSLTTGLERKKQLEVKIANSRWSKGISLAAQNSSGKTFVIDKEVKVPQQHHTFHIP
jgi:hypothetical protein